LVLRLAVYFVAAYLTVGAFFWFMQSRLLFPAPRSFEKTTPAISGLRFEDLQIAVNARDHLHAWWIPSAMPSSKVLLVFHGNGYVLEDMAFGEAASLHEVGVNLLLVDYRGYGSSSPIVPDESTVDEDAEAALNYLRHKPEVPADQLFVLGRSIGSGPATYLAARYGGLGGLILESPFTSIDDAARAIWYLRIFPIGLMLRTHFANASMISSVQTPVLIVGGTSDTLTPPWMAEEIFAHASPPRQLYLVPHAGHDDLANAGGNALVEALRKFVQATR
jgi:fermentation-respiration switch protein FrsA (DUF1100 family)